MKVAVFDTHKFDRDALTQANLLPAHDLRFIEARLTAATARLAEGCDCVCLFANDRADSRALDTLKSIGVRLVALRSAGFNHVDVPHAAKLGLCVVRVPEYSPYAVAEYAVGMLLSLNRKIHKAYNRTREMNFSLEGLVGFDLHGKTAGVVGTGRIGKVYAQIMRGFGCRVIALDAKPDLEWSSPLDILYVDKETVFRESDFVSLHVPLNTETHHLVDTDAIRLMKPRALLINTGRGALVDARALLQALKTHSIAGACLDVYEEEAGVFFHDLSESGIDDDLLARLLTFPNVLLTSHQAFLTHEALTNIAETTISSITKFENGESLKGVEVG